MRVRTVLACLSVPVSLCPGILLISEYFLSECVGVRLGLERRKGKQVSVLTVFNILVNLIVL